LRRRGEPTSRIDGGPEEATVHSRPPGAISEADAVHQHEMTQKGWCRTESRNHRRCASRASALQPALAITARRRPQDQRSRNSAHALNKARGSNSTSSQSASRSPTAPKPRSSPARPWRGRAAARAGPPGPMNHDGRGPSPHQGGRYAVTRHDRFR